MLSRLTSDGINTVIKKCALMPVELLSKVGNFGLSYIRVN